MTTDVTPRRVLVSSHLLIVAFTLTACFEPVIKAATDASVTEVDSGIDAGIDAGVDAGLTCGTGLSVCGNVCTDTRTDEGNCGQCNARCSVNDGCAGGACYPRDCAGTDCAADQVCFNQRCEFDLCLGVTCPSSSLCFRGACLSATCNGMQCPQGQACLEGSCIDPACVGVTCPSATACVQGACVSTCTPGGSCTPAGACHVGTVSCTNGVSSCTSSGTMPPGAACDGGYCNAAGTCGACDLGAACTSPSGCLVGTNSCATGEPVCSFTSVAPAGTACGGGVCGGDGGCGACVPNAACVPSNPCLQGTVSCASGAPVCNAAGPAALGTSCGAQQVCNGSGACVAACVPNQACTSNPGSPCLRGTTACASVTAAATCIDNGNSPAGDSCGGGQVCNGSGSCITLVTCYVTPTAGDRTLVMSTRNWFGYTRPITVFYKMVGGGAGPAYLPGSTGALPQLVSAGGATAILKNGTLVAAGPGMNASDLDNPRQVVSGLFTVAVTDTIRLISGGGGGFGQVGTNYTGVYNYYGLPGGGGAGYYGGGSGVRQDWASPAYPVVAPAVAFGGTGTMGGAGASPGGLGYGGSTSGGAGGGNGPANGASMTMSLWNGFIAPNYTAGGGGGYGQAGLPGGEATDCPSNPDNSGRGAGTPLATAFDLSPISGTAGFQHVWSLPGGGFWRCGVGGAPGEIVFQYQAPTCDIIPQWNRP